MKRDRAIQKRGTLVSAGLSLLLWIVAEVNRAWPFDLDFTLKEVPALGTLWLHCGNMAMQRIGRLYGEGGRSGDELGARRAEPDAGNR